MKNNLKNTQPGPSAKEVDHRKVKLGYIYMDERIELKNKAEIALAKVKDSEFEKSKKCYVKRGNTTYIVTEARAKKIREEGIGL